MPAGTGSFKDVTDFLSALIGPAPASIARLAATLAEIASFMLLIF
jgi:hypothetical protein